METPTPPGARALEWPGTPGQRQSATPSLGGSITPAPSPPLTPATGPQPNAVATETQAEAFATEPLSALLDTWNTKAKSVASNHVETAGNNGEAGRSDDDNADGDEDETSSVANNAGREDND